MSWVIFQNPRILKGCHGVKTNPRIIEFIRKFQNMKGKYILKPNILKKIRLTYFSKVTYCMHMFWIKPFKPSLSPSKEKGLSQLLTI